MDPKFIEWWECSAKDILKGCLDHIEERLVDLPEFENFVNENIDVNSSVIKNLYSNINRIEKRFKNTRLSMYKHKVKFLVLNMRDFAIEFGKYTGAYDEIIQKSKTIAEGYGQVKESLDLLFKRIKKEDSTLGENDIQRCLDDISTIKMLDDFCTDILSSFIQYQEECQAFIEYTNNFTRRKFNEFIKEEQEVRPVSLQNVLS